MVDYTFQCPECHEVTTVTRSIKDGPPSDLEHCGREMVRKYRPVKTVAFSHQQMLLDWNEENYRRMRARAQGKHAPRFSPDHVKQPGAGLPMQSWNARSLAYEKRNR